ncbi:MAG TPA: PAS domain S-box protein, partial [Vicinamibacteria bacterium]|nr:PAS domain S-box protein [Vicinamibacteria bacterium]
MRDTLPSGLRGYLVAVAATAAAVAVRWLVDPWLGDKLALVTLPAAVVVTVWVGGYRPALLAAAAGYVACARLFGRPSAGPGSDVSELLGLFVYMSSCSIILAIGEAMRRARQRQAFLWGTLGSIGDAVITTDTDGRITFMNAVAESLTGWSHRDAAGRPLVAVFRIADERTRETVENPAKRALREGAIVGLANHSVLVARDGAERPIDDSAAPIRDEGGRVVGCVLIFRDITDRRHAELTLQRSEARLRESEQRLRLALEAGRMGAWEWSAATNRVAWSPTLEAIHGLEPGTFGGTFEAYQQAVHPGDVERVCASIARAMEGGVEHHVEYRIVRRDGSVRWVEDWGRVVAGPDGAPAGIVGICADITERRRAEQARKESEERFVRFMGYLPGLAWIKDLQGRYVFANEAALKAFRTPAREGLYGRTDEEVFPPETAARFAENDRRALATGTAVQVVELLAHEDGTFHQSIVIKFPIPAPDGEAAWVGGIAIDVTEQRRVEGALRDSEARLRAVFDTVVDGIITINESGTMESVNPAAERLFGYSAAELLGRNVSMLMPDPYRREHDSYLESYRRTGQRKVIGIGREVVGLRKDGTQFPMDLGVSELSLGGRRMFTGLV